MIVDGSSLIPQSWYGIESFLFAAILSQGLAGGFAIG